MFAREIAARSPPRTWSRPSSTTAAANAGFPRIAHISPAASRLARARSAAAAASSRTGRPTPEKGAVRSRASTRRRFTSRSGGFPKIFRRAASSAAFVPASPLPSTPAASSSRPSVRAGAGARIRDGPRVSDPGGGFETASGSERVVSTSPALGSRDHARTTPGSRSRNRASSRTRNARSSAARASARVSASASLSAPSAPLSVARNAAPSMESVRVTSRAVTVAARDRARQREFAEEGARREVSESSNVLRPTTRVRDGATALDHAQARPVPTLTRDGLSHVPGFAARGVARRRVARGRESDPKEWEPREARIRAPRDDASETTSSRRTHSRAASTPPDDGRIRRMSARRRIRTRRRRRQTRPWVARTAAT